MNLTSFRDKASLDSGEKVPCTGPVDTGRADDDGNGGHDGGEGAGQAFGMESPTIAPVKSAPTRTWCVGGQPPSPARPCAATFPTIEAYRSKWAQERAKHLKKPGGDFGAHNLVPEPGENLMQDVPWIPFHKLASVEAQTRLSTVKPMGVVHEAGYINKMPTFPTKSGHVGRVQKHTNRDVDATFACLLNKDDGSFTGLSKEERLHWHECLSWAREPGNNEHLQRYWSAYERFHRLFSELTRSLLPEGDGRAKITFQPKLGDAVPAATLRDTLGDENSGLVVATDHAGAPASMRSVKNLQLVAGTQELRLDVTLPLKTAELGEQPRPASTSATSSIRRRPGGKTWRLGRPSSAKRLGLLRTIGIGMRNAGPSSIHTGQALPSRSKVLALSSAMYLTALRCYSPISGKAPLGSSNSWTARSRTNSITVSGVDVRLADQAPSMTRQTRIASATALRLP